MSARTVLYLLLLVVAAAAAVLSFAALRDLALVCGFDARLAWLLPVVVDAGAAAGSVVWLGGRVNDAARRFARALALALLGMSVAANALGHGLAAFHLAPPWWVVVIVSAVAPAVLGAVVHLAVLVGRPHDTPHQDAPDEDETGAHEPLVLDEGVQLPPAAEPAVQAERLDEHGLSRFWDHAPPAQPPRRIDGRDRVAELIADGAGRRRLSRELGISEHEARQLIDRTRTPDHNPTDHNPTDHNPTDHDTAGSAHVGPDGAGTTGAGTTGTGTDQDAAPQRVHALEGSGRSTS